MAYERLQVVGRIGSAELQYTAANNPYFRITLAVNKQGVATKWYTVFMNGHLIRDPSKLEKYKVGRQILAEGRPEEEPFAKSDGSIGIDRCIIATTYPELLDAPPKP